MLRPAGMGYLEPRQTTRIQKMWESQEWPLSNLLFTYRYLPILLAMFCVWEKYLGSRLYEQNHALYQENLKPMNSKNPENIF